MQLYCLGGGYLFKEWMQCSCTLHMCILYAHYTAHVHIYTYMHCTCAKIEHINAMELLGGMHLCREGGVPLLHDGRCLCNGSLTMMVMMIVMMVMMTMIITNVIMIIIISNEIIVFIVIISK